MEGLRLCKVKEYDTPYKTRMYEMECKVGFCKARRSGYVE